MATITKNLRGLIESSHMDNLEKKYWFEILPSLSESEAKRFEDILKDYRNKKTLLDNQYKNAIHALENGEIQASIDFIKSIEC